jgi:hypothetical protein
VVLQAQEIVRHLLQQGVPAFKKWRMTLALLPDVTLPEKSLLEHAF